MITHRQMDAMGFTFNAEASNKLQFIYQFDVTDNLSVILMLREKYVLISHPTGGESIGEPIHHLLDLKRVLNILAPNS